MIKHFDYQNKLPILFDSVDGAVNRARTKQWTVVSARQKMKEKKKRQITETMEEADYE